MIIATRPRALQVVREVWRPLAVLFAWDVIVTAFYEWSPFKGPPLPLTLFGTVLGLALGFRVNSAYARWWEGRVLWGATINASRSLARMAGAFLRDEAARDLRRTLVLRQVAFAHALARQLRRRPVADAVLGFLSADEAAPALARANVANGLLDGTGMRLDEARARGWIDSVQQAAVERVLVDLSNAQGGMERLKNTPLPAQYRFLPQVATRLFCVLLPVGLVETLGLATPVGSALVGVIFLGVLAIGDDLVDPFAGTVHDLPLDAMCRTIEIDLKQAIGDVAPAALAPVDGVLW